MQATPISVVLLCERLPAHLTSNVGRMEGILYRGVHESRFSGVKSALVPKEPRPFTKEPKWDVAMWDNSTWGTSTINAVIEHQHAQEGLPTSGLSTTPFFERARLYALGRVASGCGYVLFIDIEKCQELGIEQYRVNTLVHHPAVPEDDEVILVAPSGDISEQVVVKVERVCADVQPHSR